MESWGVGVWDAEVGQDDSGEEGKRCWGLEEVRRGLLTRLKCVTRTTMFPIVYFFPLKVGLLGLGIFGLE